VRWLREQPPVGHPDHKPIFMRELFADIPAGVRLPLEDLTTFFFGSRGWPPYWASSIGFMLGMAIMAGRDAQMRPVSDEAVSWIGLYGIDLAASSEYADQRPNAEYFIGLAQGLGIQIEIAPGSALLKNDHVYGFETREEKEGVNGLAFLRTRLAELEEQRNKTICALNTFDGMRDEIVYHIQAHRT
jgi:hypothetical protein